MKNGINFLMDTDWIFQNQSESGVDYEYLKYKLLAYLNKVDEQLEEKKIYPLFPEISLHFTNIESLISNNQYLRYTKEVNNCDDELLIAYLEKVNMPELSDDELKELKLILEFAEAKFFKYYFLFKALWDDVYKNSDVSIIRNNDNMNVGIGFMGYNKNDFTYVWEYEFSSNSDKILINDSKFDLIYSGNTSLSVEDIVEYNTERFRDIFYEELPISVLKFNADYPIIESVLPIYKKKMIDIITKSSLTGLKKIS